MATLRFAANQTVDDALYTDIQLLNGFNDEQFAQFITIFFQFLSAETSSSEFMGAISAFAAKQGVNVARLKGTLRSTLLFFKGALKNHLTAQQVCEDLITLGLDEAKSRYSGGKWKENFLKLASAVGDSTLRVNELVDMEWRFGVTSGTEELKTVGSSFLQLKMILKTEGGTQGGTEPVNMELTLPQFYSFLHEMESARSSLEFFSQ